MMQLDDVDDNDDNEGSAPPVYSWQESWWKESCHDHKDH